MRSLIDKGTCIESIPSFFIDQINESRGKSSVCEYCTKYFVKVCCAKNITTNFESSDYVSCTNGCGAIFCSIECQINANRFNSHWLYCTGRHKERKHKLTLDFVNYSNKKNAIYLVILKVIGRLIANALLNLCHSHDNARCEFTFHDKLAHNVNQFHETFPTYDSLEGSESDYTLDVDECLNDSYALFIALMRYERLPPFDLFSVSISKDDYIDSVCSVFTLSAYRSIFLVVSTHMVPIKLEQPLHPTLALVKNIPRLSKYSERQNAVEAFKVEAEKATAFLTPGRGSTVLSDELVAAQFTVDAPTKSRIEIERNAARLSQAADLANSSSDSDCNPFSGMCFVATALIPSAVFSCPSQQVAEASSSFASDESVSHHVVVTKPTTHCRLQHSCVPNVHLEAYLDSTNAYGDNVLKIRVIALRDIYPHEELSHCYIDTQNGSTNSSKARREAFQKKVTEVYGPTASSTTSTAWECTCIRCVTERNPHSLVTSLTSPYYSTKEEGITLGEAVTAYCRHDMCAVAPSLSSVLPSKTAQCLLLELLGLKKSSYHTVSNRSNASQTTGSEESIDDLFVQLSTARVLADAYMQEGDVGEGMTLYCSIVLAYYQFNTVTQHTNTIDDDVSHGSQQCLKRLVGDVVLSIGNALLDMSITIAIVLNNSSTQVVHQETIPEVLTHVDADKDLAARKIAMLTATPWQLCHTVWKLGNDLLGLDHAVLSEHCVKLKSYAYHSDAAVTAADSENAVPQHQYLDSDYYTIDISSPQQQQLSVTSSITCTRRHSIYLTKQPLFTSSECDHVIELAERHAVSSGSGWSTSRHYAVPTTDIPIHAIPDLLAWFNGMMKDRLGPMLRGQFTGDNVNTTTGIADRLDRVVAVHDAFVVKYQCDDVEDDDNDDNADSVGGKQSVGVVSSSSSNQRYLPLHSDQSTHSLTIALNSRGEYSGGGTYFAALDTALKPDKGHVLSFCGELLHGGDPILSGTRYILAIFLLLQTETPTVAYNNDQLSRKRKHEVQSQSSLAGVFKNRILNSTGNGECDIVAGVAKQNDASENQTEELFSFVFESDELLEER